MPRRRFFVPPENIRGGTAHLDPEQVHHLRDVLRIPAGEEVELFDGRGNSYIGRIRGRGGEFVVASLEAVEGFEYECPIEVVLAPALIKTDRFEWILQKAAELGAAGIHPLATRYSAIKIPADRIRSRKARWEKILREASRQCGRSTVPQLHLPLQFEEFLRQDPFPGATRFIFHDKAAEGWSSPADERGRYVLCTGPEGGWHPDEVEAAVGSGFRVFSLGPRILRAETAAVAALAVVQYCLGDLGRPVTRSQGMAGERKSPR